MKPLAALTLPGRVFELAQRMPDEVAIRNKDFGIWQETSWAAYLRRLEQTAHGLAWLGVGADDHVAILSDNCPEWVYADLAAQALGARSVGIYQTNPPADVAYILEHAKCRVLFCEDQEQVDKVVEVAENTPSVERVVVFDPRGTRGYADSRLVAWDDFLAEGERRRLEQPGWVEEQVAKLDPETPSMVVYTSGTTGPPKGAMISSANVLGTSQAMLAMLGVSQGDSVLSYLPLCHVAEKIFTVFLPLSAGAVVHFGESIETIRADLCEVSPTIFLGVPRIWEKMHASVTLRMKDSSWLKRRLFEFFQGQGALIVERRRQGRPQAADSLLWWLGDLLIFRPLQERLGLRRCHLPVSGAAPVGVDLLRWFHSVGIPVREGYGQTECAGVSHLNLAEDNRLGTVGVPVEGTEQRIAEDGEILVRGAHVFCGYLHNEEATRNTIDEDGWLHTGDVGTIDDGYLRITGRKKEIIITAGGKNLSPEKIENALKTSPYIKEVVAIGDGRKFIAALVQADGEAVGDWAGRQGIPYTSYEDLVSRSEVVSLLKEEVDRANELLARVEQVRACRLFPKELHQDDGELTATQKVRRREVQQIYSELIEAMYSSGKAAS